MSRSADDFAVSTDGFALPVSDVLTGRGFVTGKSGSGKSNTASVIAEELLNRNLPLLIVDTDGEYYGLSEEYEVLLAGAADHHDLTVTPGDGHRIARLALDESLPVILDISGFLEESDTRDLIYETVQSLFQLEQSRMVPFLLVIEEAHEFIPQGGGSDELSDMLIRVAKRGRKRGLGICAMSQRPAAVDKDYITQCDWIVWHRLTWDNDTAVAERILGDGAAETVQKLDDGEAIVMTDWDESVRRVQFRRKHTLDAGATPDLEHARSSADERSDLIKEISRNEQIVQRRPDDETDDTPDEDERSGSHSKETIQESHPDPDEREEPEEELDHATSDDELDLGSTSSDGSANSGGTVTLQKQGSSPSTEGDHVNSSAIDTVSTRRPASRSVHMPPRRSIPQRRQPPTPMGDDESSDPIWEIGYLIVYLYGMIVTKHLQLYDRIDVTLAYLLETIRWKVKGPTSVRPYGSSWVLILAKYLSVLLIVAIYAIVIAGGYTLLS